MKMFAIWSKDIEQATGVFEPRIVCAASKEDAQKIFGADARILQIYTESDKNDLAYSGAIMAGAMAAARR